MKWLMGSLLALFIILGGFVMTPSPIDAKAWQAPPSKTMAGPLAPNEHLRQAELLAKGQVYGPEDTTVNSEGVVFAGTQDGYIVRVFPDGRVENWLSTGGRPLGMVFDQNGNLIVADAWKGLLSVSPDGEITVLATEAEGVPFRFADDLDIAPDGRIYFSDASSRFYQQEYLLDLLEMRPHGRLLRYSPETGETEVLVRGMHFANGVAVAPGGDYVLVNETWKYRIQRYWIDGPRAGQAEVFVDNLLGFPDNLAVDEQGRFWVAFPSLRNAAVDALHSRPWLKELVAKVPQSMQLGVKEYGLVVAFDSEGSVITSLHDTGGQHLQEITSVNPHAGFLYFGSLHNDRIGRMPLKDIPGIGEH